MVSNVPNFAKVKPNPQFFL